MSSTVAVALTTLLILTCLGSVAFCQRPAFVNVGAVFTFDSVIGRAAKVAMEIAVSDVNEHPNILNGTKLRLIMEDANCSVFFGSMRAFQVIDKEVVTIIGPQSSAIAHMISQVASGLQMPLLSYAATDPTLSSLQFPYFVRSTQSDSCQMAAMADLIDFYGWKKVIAIFVDDDYGRNGIFVLGNELFKKRSMIAYKFPLPPQLASSDIIEALNISKVLGPRVYVVHVSPDPSLRIFRIAEKLGMMTSDYVWLATDWLSTTLDSYSPEDRASLKLVEGVVGLRQHALQSPQKMAFETRWRNMQRKGLVNAELNVYGYQAYDTMWAVARSIGKYLHGGGNFTFTPAKSQDKRVTEINLGKLKVFDAGEQLLAILSKTNFTGLFGQVRFTADHELDSGSYDVINIVQMEIRTVGYWSNSSGLSILPPQMIKDGNVGESYLDQKLDIVTWPGGKTEKSRGWVLASDEKPLRIGVPRRVSFIEFVTKNNSNQMQGYCMDVFDEVLKLVPYDVPCKFEPFGDGLVNPNYDQLVNMVAADIFDAAVGDIAIVTSRTEIVDFTQPYADTRLVIVAPVKRSRSSADVFLRPLTFKMWGMIAASFVMIAVVIWILEHRVNDDFRGPPKRQLTTIFLFSLSTLFKRNRERVVSPLARIVMVVWLFLLMVITASYNASLTSILTVQQLPSSITGIESLIASKWPIGYQAGSFSYNYLTDNLSIHSSRLVPLGSPEEYDKALRLGPNNRGVAAIVDELPYVELFLSNRTEFGIVGQPITKSGWGFVFRKDSPLAIDISTAILKLLETKKLQTIHNEWFCRSGRASEGKKDPEPHELQLSSFLYLYMLCGVFILIVLLVFFIRTACQYVQYKRREMDLSTPSCSALSNDRFSQIIFQFFDFIDEKEEAIKRIFSQGDNPQPQVN